MPLTNEQRRKIELLFTAVVERAFARLENLTLSGRALNPFMAVLIARRPRELAEFIVHQRVERGLVTSLGMQIQKIVHIVGKDVRPSAVKGADFERVDQAQRRHIIGQLKSGPDTINLDIANQIARDLNSAESRLRSGGLPADWAVVKMLGMAYGTPKHRNSWVLGLATMGLDVDKIGRTFWEFTSGEQQTYREVFDIALDVANSYRDSKGRTLVEAIQDTIASLTTELRLAYSDRSGDIRWDLLVEENM